MRKSLKFAVALTAGIWCLVPSVVHAHSAGPPAGAVGPPLGERSCASMGCQTSVGGGKGSVTLSSPNGLNYTPGLEQHMVLTIADPTQQRWGFEASARPASNPSSAAVGDFASSDAFTQVICFNNSTKPVGQACPGLPNFQYVEHTAQGTRNGAAGAMTFEFDWAAPDGKVIGPSPNGGSIGGEIISLYGTDWELQHQRYRLGSQPAKVQC